MQLNKLWCSIVTGINEKNLKKLKKKNFKKEKKNDFTTYSYGYYRISNQ